MDLFFILAIFVLVGYFLYLAWPKVDTEAEAYQQMMYPRVDELPDDENEIFPILWADPKDRPQWLIKLARFCATDPWDWQAMDRLEAWTETIIQVAANEFNGSLSAKIYLYPHFQTADYQDIPTHWRTLHFFERFSNVLRDAGLAELRNNRQGVRLNRAGLDHFHADPDEWYP